MFIHRILIRIHKLKTPVAYTNNLRLSSNYINQQLTTRPSVVKNVIYTSTRRNISFQSLKKPNIDKFKVADNIPNNYDLIYRCTMSSYLYAAQMSATIGVIIVCVLGIFNLNTNKVNDFQINYDYVDLQNVFNSDLQMVVFSVGFILINIAVMVLVSKFPVRIYFDKDSKRYIGVLYGKIPKTKKTLEFNTGDIIHKPVNGGILPWGEYRYKLKTGKSIIMLDHYFRKPDDMNIMLGYTKM